jgi:hypothetical protein
MHTINNYTSISWRFLKPKLYLSRDISGFFMGNYDAVCDRIT